MMAQLILVRVFLFIIVSIGSSVSGETLTWGIYIEGLTQLSLSHTEHEISVFYQTAYQIYKPNVEKCLYPSRSPLVETTLYGPCGKIKIAWDDQAFYPAGHVLTWNILSGYQSNFYLNLTFVSFSLVNSLRNCRPEYVKVATEEKGVEGYEFRRLCGEKNQMSIAIMSERFSLKYYVYHALALARQNYSELANGRGIFFHYHATNTDIDIDRYATTVVSPMSTLSGDIKTKYNLLMNGLLAVMPYSRINAVRIGTTLTSMIVVVAQMEYIVNSAAKKSSCFVTESYDGPDKQSRQLRPYGYMPIKPTSWTAQLPNLIKDKLNTEFTSSKGKIVYFERTVGHISSIYIKFDMNADGCYRNDLVMSFVAEGKPISYAESTLITKESTILTLPVKERPCRIGCNYRIVVDPGWFPTIKNIKFTMSGPKVDNWNCLYRAFTAFRSNYLGKLKPGDWVKWCNNVLVKADGVLRETFIPAEYTSDSNEIRMGWYSYPRGNFQIEMEIVKSKCRGTYIEGGDIKANTVVMAGIGTRVTTNFATIDTLPFADPTPKHAIGQRICRQYINAYRYPRMRLISHQHAEHCVEETIKTVTNKLSVNGILNCFVFQHIVPTKLNPNLRYVSFNMGILPFVQLQEKLNVTFSVHTEFAEECRHFSSSQGNWRIAKVIDSYESVEFQPECSSVTVTGARIGFDRFDVSDTKIENIFNTYMRGKKTLWTHRDFIPYFLDNLHHLIPESIASIYKLTQRQISLFHHSLESIRWGVAAAETLDKFKTKSYWNPYTMLLNHISLLSLTVDQDSSISCDNMTVKLVIIHEDFFPAADLRNYRAHQAPHTNYWRYHLHIRGADVGQLYDFQLFNTRTMLIHAENHHQTPDVNCTLSLDIQPDLSINQVSRSYHRIEDTKCCNDIPENIYYVLWLRTSGSQALMSWSEAERECQKTGGHLPHILSEIDISLIENLIMGSRFGSKDMSFFSPSRLYNQMFVYIGKQLHSVRK